MYGMIRPSLVSNSPMLRQTSNSEPTIEIGGNIAIASAPERISALPPKSSRASA
jgi:hypothetical protein